jgi:hypothetical protein
VKARPGREALALVLLGVAAIVIALGPEIRLMGRTLVPGPFGIAREAFPLFRMIRVTSRAGIFLALALSLLAALTLTRWRVAPRFVALVSALALAEAAIVPIPLPVWAQVVDTRRPPPAVYAWLAAQPGEVAVAELPIMDDDGLFRRPACDESIYMVRSMLHWKRLVNGYAGGEPEDHKTVRALARRFPSAESVAAFRGLGVRYVILHAACYGPNQWARIERDLPAFGSSLREVARFGDDAVLEVQPLGGP